MKIKKFRMMNLMKEELTPSDIPLTVMGVVNSGGDGGWNEKILFTIDSGSSFTIIPAPFLSKDALSDLKVVKTEIAELANGQKIEIPFFKFSIRLRTSNGNDFAFTDLLIGVPPEGSEALLGRDLLPLYLWGTENGRLSYFIANEELIEQNLSDWESDKTLLIREAGGVKLVTIKPSNIVNVPNVPRQPKAPKLPKLPKPGGKQHFTPPMPPTPPKKPK